MIRLRALGACAIDVGDRRLGPDAERAFALLLVLVLAAPRPVARGWLLRLLWPGATDGQRRHNLRQTVYKLRLLGVRLDSDRQTLRLADGEVRPGPALDEDDERAAAELRDPAQPFGEFLAAYAPEFSSAFASWIEEQRDVAHARLRRLLLGALLDQRRRGAWDEVERLARRVLTVDPLNEEATLALAEATALAGGKTAAIGILDAYMSELGEAAADIALPATVLRRRIAERLQPGPSLAAGESCYVGRADTTALLHEQLQRARQGHGQACLLWGDAGMGKSRALLELGRVAALSGARVQVVGSQPRDVERPLSAFVDLVPSLLALPGALGCDPASLGHLRRLTELDAARESPSPEARDAELLFSCVRRALFDLFDAVAGESCVVLGFEDVHWLDPMSWQILAELVDWCAGRRLQVVLTSRVPNPSALPAGLPTSVRVHRLPPLEDGAAVTLLAAVLGGGEGAIPATFRDWCVHVAEGNPYLLRALAAHWLETGSIGVPPSLQALIEERLRRLDSYALRTLQACAILGRNSTLDRLERTLEHRRFELLQSISELESCNLLAADGPLVPPKHDLIAEVALSYLSYAAQRLLQRIAARVLQDDIETTNDPSLLWDCANHWAQAGEREQGMEVIIRYAIHLTEIGLPAEAGKVLDAALAWCSLDGERLRILEQLKLTVSASGEWKRVTSIIDTIDSITGRSRDSHSDDELLRLEAQWRAGDAVESVVRRIMQCVLDHSDADHQLKAATLALALGDNVCAAELMDAVFRKASELHSAPGVSSIDMLAAQLIYNTSRGDPYTAVSIATQYVTDVRHHGNPHLLARSLRYSALAMRRAGMFSDAYESLREGLSIGEQFRLTSACRGAIDGLVNLFLDQEQVDNAALWFQYGNQFYPNGHEPTTDAFMVHLGARIAIENGNMDEADRLLRLLPKGYAEDPAIRRRSEALAHCVRVAIERPSVRPLKTTVGLLLQTHLVVRGWGGQDYSTLCLALGLVSLDCAHDASRLVQAYRTVRRERYPMPSRLSALLTD